MRKSRPYTPGIGATFFAIAVLAGPAAQAQDAPPPAALEQVEKNAPVAALEPAEKTAPVAKAEAPSSARQVIDALHVDLLEVMKAADELGYSGREEKLATVVPQHFDVDFMARKSLGRYWAQSDEVGRARYLETFERFMVANYAGRFDGWSGQSFVIEGEEPAGRGTVLVQSRLINPADDDVELKYRLRPVNETWKVIDVFLDGTVSELALRYSEFVGIVKREDLDALITAIDERIAKLAADG
ncbi:MAG: ABC transporter substrate-binding protein [Myxococcota bacterium]